MIDMNQMMDQVGSMMGGMGIIGLLFVILLVLGIAALAKYLLLGEK